MTQLPPSTYDPARGADLDRARELLGLLGGFLTVRTDAAMLAVLAREGYVNGVAWLAAGLYAEYAQNPTSLSSSGESVSFGNLLTVWARLSARVLAGVADPLPLPGAGVPQSGLISAGAGRASRLR